MRVSDKSYAYEKYFWIFLFFMRVPVLLLKITALALHSYHLRFDALMLFSPCSWHCPLFQCVIWCLFVLLYRLPLRWLSSSWRSCRRSWSSWCILDGVYLESKETLSSCHCNCYSDFFTTTARITILKIHLLFIPYFCWIYCCLVHFW